MEEVWWVGGIVKDKISKANGAHSEKGLNEY